LSERSARRSVGRQEDPIPQIQAATCCIPSQDVCEFEVLLLAISVLLPLCFLSRERLLVQSRDSISLDFASLKEFFVLVRDARARKPETSITSVSWPLSSFPLQSVLVLFSLSFTPSISLSLQPFPRVSGTVKCVVCIDTEVERRRDVCGKMTRQRDLMGR